MSRSVSSPRLPAAMAAKLRSIRRRQTLLAAARALALGAAALLAAMVLAMAVDWLLMLRSPAPRVMLTASAILAAAAVLLLVGLPYLLASLGWKRAAADADSCVPELEERWMTVASFTRSLQQPMTASARAMLDQVTSEAAAMERLVEPRHVARPAALRPALLTLAAGVLLAAGFLALDTRQTSVLLRRFWSPTANIAATQLVSVTGDVTVPRGESVELAAQLSGVPRRVATLDLRHESGIVDLFELQPDDKRPNHFLHTLRAANSLRYRVRAGDGQTQWHTVSVVDYPDFAVVRFTITAPEYVDRPSYEKSLIPSRVKVVQGSRLDLQMKPRAPLQRLELTLSIDQDEAESDVQTLVLQPDTDGWYRFAMPLLEDVTLLPVLLNEHGLTNENRRSCRIQVVADKAPVARVVAPTTEMAVAEDDVIEIEFEAHDDFGIQSAELVVYDHSTTSDGDKPRVLHVQPIPLGDQQLQRHVLASTQLDLKQLALQEGMQISYAVRVTDNRLVPLSAQAPAASSAGDLTDREHSPQRRVADAAREPGPGPADDPAGVPQTTADDHDTATAMLASAGDRSAPGSDRDDSSEKDSSPHSHDEAGSELASNGTSTPADEPTTQSNTDPPNVQGAAAAHAPPAGEATAQRMPARDQLPDSKHPATNLTEAMQRPNAIGPAVSASPPSSKDPRTDNHTPTQQSDRPWADVGETAGRKHPEQQTAGGSQAMVDSEKRTRPGSRRESTDDERPMNDADARSLATSSSESPATDKDSNSTKSPVAMSAQRAESGQNTETSRRTLKITQRLLAVATAQARNTASLKLRERIAAIDALLEEAESGLRNILDRTIPDAQHGEQYRRLDERLGEVETSIAALRAQTQEQADAFIGLQMVDIGRTHVTPARDAVFIAIRDVSAARRHASDALQHVVRARELLAGLLKRYDRVERERELADALEEVVTMYEVYVEQRHRLLREARQNKNPLQRRMSVIEVDQDYLDRYTEVLTLRREMMAEFARMLADDPRLLARYLDQLKRRRSSLRDQLAEVSERQYELASELTGWRSVQEPQRDNLWRLIAGMRLPVATALASDAAQLAERVQKQLPLVLEPTSGTAPQLIGHVQEIARIARQLSFRSQDLLEESSDPEQQQTLLHSADQLIDELREFDAALDQLTFEFETDAEVTGYVTSRLLESRAVADQADQWSTLQRHVLQRQYHGLAEVEQHQTAIATELLRVEMLDFESDLDGQFQRITETSVPGEIIDLVRQLHREMESVTYHQASATFLLHGEQLADAERRQALAVAGLERAEELFDRIRRAVIAALDEYDEDDPNIADLEDPTLDEFLARLEREPNIQAQLGIPNRPRNLRVIADVMTNAQPGGDMLGDSERSAMQRAREAMKMRREPRDAEPLEPERSDEQREQDRQMQQLFEQSLAKLQQKIDDPQTSEQQRKGLQKMAENMQRMLDQTGEPSADAAQWQRLAQSDQALAMLRALASGETIPDEQWNKLLSTLDDGLWQVRGRTPPEEYRRAIEQYQDRLRQLMDTVTDDAA